MLGCVALESCGQRQPLIASTASPSLAGFRGKQSSSGSTAYLAEWDEAEVEASVRLKQLRPVLPNSGGDRQQEVVRGLLLGGEVPGG